MKDLALYYPLVPTSLITNPLDARKQDFMTARRIISLIAVRYRQVHGLTERNMAVIPHGVRYHGVEIGDWSGELQITEHNEDRYTLLAYQEHNGAYRPRTMRMGLSFSEINDVLSEISETLVLAA